MPRRPALHPALVRLAVITLLFGGTILLYSRVVGYGFLNYDDPRYITANPHIQAPLGWSTVAWAFTARYELWQPLTWLSHALDWQIYGDAAAGHHLTSVLWHALNAVLAFVVFRRLTRTLWPSAFTAALFAWHPLRVESVAWVTERKDVMSGTFFLLTIWAYAAYAEHRRAAAGTSAGFASVRPVLRYALAVALFGAGLMCKPTLVTLPFLLLALDFWPLRRSAVSQASAARSSATPTDAVETWPRLVGEKAPFFALSVIVGLITLRFQKGYGAFTLDLPLGARLANVPVAIGRYLGKFFWPANLSVCYPHPGWWPPADIVAATLLVGVITVLAWRCRRSRPWIMTGWVWMVALLLPTIGIVQVGFQSLADRYTYLPLFGLELGVIWTVRAFCTSAVRRTIGGILVAAVLAVVALRTWQQEAVWRDSETLFRHAIAASGSSSVAEGFLGYTLAGLGQAAEAEQHCKTALVLDPKNEMAVYTLAGIHAAQGRVDEAIAGYRRSLELKPNEPGTEYDLAIQLLRRGDTPEAAKYLRMAVHAQPALLERNRTAAELSARAGNANEAALRYAAAALVEPDNARAQFAAGYWLVRAGRDDAARAALQRAVELAPDLAEAQTELGLLLLNHHEPAAALPHFRAALQREPSLASAQVGLGRTEEELGDRTEADVAFRAALAAAPRDAGVSRAWAEVLARRGQFTDALKFYRQAVALRPDDATNHAGLGYMLFLTGHRPEAVNAWQEALRLNPNFPGLRERLRQLGY